MWHRHVTVNPCPNQGAGEAPAGCVRGGCAWHRCSSVPSTRVINLLMACRSMAGCCRHVDKPWLLCPDRMECKLFCAKPEMPLHIRAQPDWVSCSADFSHVSLQCTQEADGRAERDMLQVHKCTAVNWGHHVHTRCLLADQRLGCHLGMLRHQLDLRCMHHMRCCIALQLQSALNL